MTQLRKLFLSSTLNEFLGLGKKNHNSSFIIQNIWANTHALKWRTTFYTQKNEKKLYYTVGMNVVVDLKLSMNNKSETKFTYNAFIFHWARGKVFNWDNQKTQAFDATNLHFHNLAFFKLLSWHWYVHDFWTYYTV